MTKKRKADLGELDLSSLATQMMESNEAPGVYFAKEEEIDPATRSAHVLNEPKQINIKIVSIASDNSFDAKFKLQALEVLYNNSKTNFDCRNLATLCHRVAKLFQKNFSATANDFLRSLVSDATKKLTQFNSQDLSNIAWAFAKLNIKDTKFFSALLKEIDGKLTQFNSQELSNTAWAFAKQNIKNDKFFSALSKEICGKLPQANTQGLSNTAWAFAKLNIKDDELFSTLSKAIIGKLEQFNSQELSNTAWAFAKVNIKDDELFSALSKEVSGKFSQFNSQELSNTTWAFAVLAIENSLEFYHLLETCILSTESFQFSDEQLLQLYHASLLMPFDLHSEINERVKVMLAVLRKQQCKVSSWEKEVGDCLINLGYKPKSQVFVEGLKLDFLIEEHGMCIAVECDGARYHHVGGKEDSRPVGSQVLKDRLLQRLGFRVVHIVYERWRSSNNKQKFLKDLLKSPDGQKSQSRYAKLAALFAWILKRSSN